mgnify:CR=1 FL=1
MGRVDFDRTVQACPFDPAATGRRLRRGGYDRPIVGLTAAVVGEEMDRFRTAGVNVVMKKPLDFDRLVQFLREGFPSPEEAAGQAPSD